jgi:hypothetical protein
MRRERGNTVRRTFLRRSFLRFAWLFTLFLAFGSTFAIAQTSGQLVPNPWTLNFGTIAVGSTGRKLEILKNSGKSKLTITRMSVTGAAFSAQGWTLPLTLAPGQSKVGTVKFTPSSSGGKSGILVISWRSKNTNHSNHVSLTGIALGSGKLTSHPAPMSFGSVQVGSSKRSTGTLTNSTARGVTISAASTTASGFRVGGLNLPLTIKPGQSTTYTVTFSPRSSGSFSGNLSITSSAPNHILNVALTGTGAGGGQVTANPTNLNFGSVQTGSKKTLSERLSNSGTAALTISQIAPHGTGFSLSGINPPVTLSPGQSFTFNVSFASSSTGTTNGTLSVSSNAVNPSLSIPLTGSGTTGTPGQLAVSPASINFGNVPVGSSQKQTARLTVTNGPVTVSSASITGTEFSVSGISFPLTIASGQSASLNVTFAPQASGSASATLVLSSNATNGSVAESFGGTGTAPSQHSVTLTWNASTSSNVVGYNIYRGGQSGGPYAKINSALGPSTTDTDTNVQSGSTYYYVVTAVDSSGHQSAYSSQVKAVVP